MDSDPVEKPKESRLDKIRGMFAPEPEPEPEPEDQKFHEFSLKSYIDWTLKPNENFMTD